MTPKLEVHTLRYGNLPWITLCGGTLDQWCHRHELPLTVWGEEAGEGLPTAKFATIKMIEAFLAGDSTHMMYVDADVYVDARAPFPDMLDVPGFHASTDDPHVSWIPRWRGWCEKVLGEVPNLRFVYRNSGIWVCDRAAAEVFLSVAKPPYHEMIQEQHQVNYWWSKAKELGMPMPYLDTKWNRYGGDLRAAHFYHLWGTNKEQQLQMNVDAGLIPHQPEFFEELPAPTVPRAIVYPYHEDFTQWQELRYSLRSIEKFFADKECPIYIFSARPINFLIDHPRIKVFDCWTYENALTRGVQSADKVLWMNDDIVLLKPTSWEDCEQTMTLGAIGNRVQDPTNDWKKGVQRIVRALRFRGIEEPQLFCTHTPYVYEREKALQCFREFGVWEKMPLEMAYFNLFAKDPTPPGGRRTFTADFGDAHFLNHTDGRLTDELKQAIRDLLPDFAEWELQCKFQQ
jgi:hypothetical protein